MRVLEVAQPPHGGVAEHLRTVTSALPEHGVEPEAVLVPGSRAAAPLAAAGIAVHELRFSSSIWDVRDDLRATAELRRLIRARDPDLIHAHGAKAGVLGRLAAVLARRPAIYTPHGWAFNEYEFRNPPPSLAHRATAIGTERTLARAARFIVCVSEFEARSAARRGIPDGTRLRVIHHGVAVDESAEPDPQMSEWKGDRVLFGAVSVLRPEKGHRFLVDAADSLREAAPGACFALVGEGDRARGELEHRIEAAGLESTVRVFPYSGRMEPHLRALDCYVQPSHQFEALGIGAIEAMALGVPVIATEVGGVPEVVVDGSTGLLVPPADAAALARAVERLASDPALREAMGESGRTRARSSFALGDEVRALAELYREALSPRAAL
jgi:glycosyltransferase involved in cell wall biosynthesis